MSLSHFLAGLIGPLWAIVGLSMLLNRQRYTTMIEYFMEEPATTFIGGVMALIVGLALVMSHNIWVADWRVLITVVGWGGIIKGTVLLMFPDAMKSYVKIFTGNPTVLTVMSVIIIPVGLWISWMGWAS